MQSLPIDAIRPDVTAALQQSGCIIHAPPGSGKTTRVPLWCLNERLTFVLIPTRIAVLLAATRLAEQRNEKVGQTIGYRLRLNSNTSAASRVIVTTYGSFLQSILNDPEQIMGATIIYDEFHERSLEQDLCFALVNQFIQIFDDSIKQIFMSATLNVEQLKSLTQLPLISTEGKAFPVAIHYQPIDLKRSDNLVRLIESTWQSATDHVLVFLEGWRSIQQLAQHLNPRIPCLILHGQMSTLPPLDSLATAAPTVILATNIAESSITLARVHTVIDTGLERFASAHPVTGISQLITRKISQSSATQRAGRAGRLAPGNAIRCWSEDEQKSRVLHQPPEIDYANLDQLLLNVAAWGAQVDELVWLNPPSHQRLLAARQKLTWWQAIDSSVQITDHGKAIIKTGLEPWLGHFIATAQSHGRTEAAIVLATMINGKQPLTFDPTTRNTLPAMDAAAKRELQRLMQRLSCTVSEPFEPLSESLLIEAFSDRLVWQEGNRAFFITGTEVQFHTSGNQTCGILLDAQKSGSSIKVYGLLPLTRDAIMASSLIKQELHFRPEQKPHFVLQKRLGAILIDEKAHQPSDQERVTAWLTFIEAQGERALCLSEDQQQLKRRWQFAEKDDAIIAWPSEQWHEVLLPFMTGVKHLNEVNLTAALQHYCGYEAWQKLNTCYPSHWQAPSGRVLMVHYEPTSLTISVELKLQEAFGLCDQPKLGNHPLTLKLTAPNGRTVAQVTDIKHFWTNIYPEVRKELRGRYAKHPWPEDPLTADATVKTKKQLSNHSVNQ